MAPADGAVDEFRHIVYERHGRVAHVVLNRPKQRNALTLELLREIRRAVQLANADEAVRVLVLRANGESFCGGYDLKLYAEEGVASQPMPWDPYKDYALMSEMTECMMSLWRSLKPVIAQVHGHAIAGGSDLLLCADLLAVSEDAVLGYPPARLWGCPTTFMWIYRCGLTHAKRLLLTGDVITGAEAARIGLASFCFKSREELAAGVDQLSARMALIPSNQLFFQKAALNHAAELMGVASAQRLAVLFDGMARHSPEGVAFRERCHEVGFKQAVIERDQPHRTAHSSGSQVEQHSSDAIRSRL